MERKPEVNAALTFMLETHAELVGKMSMDDRAYVNEELTEQFMAYVLADQIVQDVPPVQAHRKLQGLINTASDRLKVIFIRKAKEEKGTKH